MSLYNKGSKADKLLDASTPNATSVDIVHSDGKLLPDGVDLRTTGNRTDDKHSSTADLAMNPRGCCSVPCSGLETGQVRKRTVTGLPRRGLYWSFTMG
jgi:hypothetical protein